jgi:spore coat protein H
MYFVKNPTLRNAWPILLVFCISGTLFTPLRGFAQGELELKDNTSQAAINTFAFTTDPKKLKQIHDSRGKKISIRVDEVRVNNVAIPAEYLRIRGSSSSHYYRKSYTIHFQKKTTFFDQKTYAPKKIYAVSLTMDRNYIRNKIAYAVLANQGITIPPHTYVNLIANSNSEGIYMAFYPPAEFALKECHSPFVIRRGYESSIKKTYNKDFPADEAKALTQQFNSIYKKILPRYKGEELYAQLDGWIDLEEYFTWMAFNHLFQNGDYTDEVYFMWNNDRKKFELIPWDFDDLFQFRPHETTPVSRNLHIFSVEDKLDEAIATDPYLYARYVKVYRNFLDAFTSEALKEIIEDIYTQVSPYFMQAEIIAQSRFDKFGKTDLTDLQNDLTSIYVNLSIRMDLIRKELSKPLP